MFLNNMHKIYPKRKPLEVHFFTVIGKGYNNVMFAAKELENCTIINFLDKEYHTHSKRHAVAITISNIIFL